MWTIISAVSIKWHRIINWECVPVTKILKVTDDECIDCPDISCYSDWGTLSDPSDWIEWDCPQDSITRDPELVCLTNDWWETITKWVIFFEYDWSVWTQRIELIWWALATWYSVIDCWTTASIEEWDVWCDNWINIIPFFEVETDGVATWTVAFWLDPISNAQVTPSWSQTPWACEVIVPNRQVDVIEDCAWTITATDVSGEIAKEVILSGSTKSIDVRIKENCIASILRDVDIEVDCIWTTETVQVEGNVQEVILHPTQELTVKIDESCDTTRDVNVLEDCAGTTTTTPVDNRAAKEVILWWSTKNIPVRIVEDCAIPQVVPVPNCDWTTTNQNVDEITATYLLNQQNKHTEIMYDVVGAWLSWSALFWYTAPTNVWVDYSGVTITWDAILSYWTDFGDWYNDVWRSPSHSYNADGSYEIKGYAITASGNKLLLFAKEVNITSWTIIYWGANPQPVNRTYNILSSAVLQDYCNNTPVYTYKPNWWAYTTVWTLFVVKPDIIDELEDNADYQASISSPTNTVQTSTVLQLDAFWTIVWQVLRLDRVYDNTGALVSETYYDTVTWLPVLLNPLTAQIIDAHWLDTEIIELCDDNWTFLRHIWHAPWWQPISQRDTAVDWMTAYTTVWTVRKCTECKKEIFATHIKWLNVPAVAYEMVPTLANHYWWANDATNTYIHLIYPIQAGTSLTPIWPQLTEYFANPQNWVLFTDVATIQAMTDNALLQMWLSVWDAIYAVNTDNEPIWILSPTAEAELANSTYLHIYYWTVDTHNSYDQKADVNAIATNPNILLWGAWTWSCKPIQEIKEKDSCTWLETYRYIIEDGAWNLVPVTDVYPAFVESDVLHEPCKEPEVLEIREKEVCGFVDWSTSSYQLIRLYTRDSITWAMTIVWYEDVFWNAVTWAVVETCCTCDSICWEIAWLPLANRRWNSYGSFFWHNFSTIWTDRAYNNGPMYDQLALSIWWPTWSPMNHYNRVNVFDWSWTLITTAILWPYSPLSLSSSYTQFLSDLSSITSWLLVTFTNAHPLWLDYWYVMEYHDTTYFGITIHHWIDDHAWGIYRNNNAKRAIKYQAWDTQPFDSVNITWDLNNAYADAGFRERTNMRSVVPLQNVITI